jgi:hypothetical protein
VVGLDVYGYKNQNKFKEQTMIPFAALLSIGEKVLDKVIPDPEAKAKAQATLMEMAQRGELAQLEAQVQEMQSARDREVQIATSEFAPMLSKIVTPILALGTVGLTFILFAVIIFVDVDSDSKDILDLCTRCADLCGHHGAWAIILDRRLALKKRVCNLTTS